MKTALFLLAIFVFIISAPQQLSAQRQFSKTYQASRNVSLQLKNSLGTVTVSGWQRNEIRVIAKMESSSARIEPTINGDTLEINVVRDNQGRGDYGGINFDIKVPFSSTVDIETLTGNLEVRDVSSSMVRANITGDGDITLTNIKSGTVMAQNIRGDIFFDGELQSGGNYRFATTRGNVNISIPFTSSFRLTATAPSTRQIELGSFSNAGLNFVSDGRRVMGSVGDGRASLTIINKLGSISFIRR